MATKKIKINFKMPTPTAAERLHAQQQKNRKAAGLPDPSEYKKKLDSMKSEEVEQLDEISAELKASYVAGAKKQIKQSLPFTKKTDEYRDIAKNFIAKRQKGIAKANEEVEQLDEMPESNMKTKDVHSHLKKSGWSLARSKGGHDVYKHPKAKHSIPVPRHNQLKAPLIRGIMKASKVEEQLEKKGRFVSGPVKQPYKSNTIVTAVKESFRIGGMGGRGGGRGNIYMYDRNPGPRDDDESGHVPYVPKTEHQKKLQKALTDLGNKMKETHPKLREAKDSQEYDYEGDMAKSDLRSIIHNAQTLHDMLDDNTNLAEWCQSKITLAEDYISTVTNYMRSEMNEEVKKNEYHISGKHKFPTKDEHAVTVKHTESGREHVHSGKGKYLSKLIKTRYNINHYFEEVELDEEQHSVLYKMKKDDKKIAVAHYKSKDDAHKFLSSVKTKGGNGIVRSKTNEEVELDEVVIISTKKPIGTRVADIGPGGKEYNVKTNKAWDDSKKKQPQGADFAAQRRKERLAKSGRMDEKENLPGLWANIHAKRKRGEPPAKPGDKDYPKTLNIESAAEPTEGEMKGKQQMSRKAQIVKDAVKGKKSDSPDKFQKDPELSSEIHKT
jgi:predicted RNA binding protein YcfA (HicA-like mRNA interferase family)